MISGELQKPRRHHKYRLYFDKGPLYQHLRDTSIWKSLVSNPTNCFDQKVEKFLRISHYRDLTKIRVKLIPPRYHSTDCLFEDPSERPSKISYDSLCVGFIKNLLRPGRIIIVIRSVRFCNISHEIRGFIYFLVKEKITYSFHFITPYCLEKTLSDQNIQDRALLCIFVRPSLTYPPPRVTAQI